MYYIIKKTCAKTVFYDNSNSIWRTFVNHNIIRNIIRNVDCNINRNYSSPHQKIICAKSRMHCRHTFQSWMPW